MLPEGLRMAGPLQLLFGYGPECSGYVGTTLLGVYKGQKWVLECDYMNLFYSYGLLGVLLRYIWYIHATIRASRQNSAIWVFALAFGIMGISYNIQFNWVILFLYAAILQKESA